MRASLRLSLAMAGMLMAGLVAVAVADESKKPAEAASTGIEALDQVDLQTTGKDIKIDDSMAGEGYWTLYIPNDYDAKRKWPVIFNFHYFTGHPNAGPFDALTGTKGYIIIGLGYLDGVGNVPDVKKTMAVLKHIHDAVAKKLSVDDRLLFVGGVSQGGFRSSDYFDSAPDAFAGLIMLDSGRGMAAVIMGRSPNYAGKPIYIGDGENDKFLPEAKKAEDFYKQRGADVTMEVYKNMGHAVDMSSKTLKQWLFDHGPMVYVKLDFSDALALEKSGKKGKAYAGFQQVISMPDAGDYGDKAKAQCEAIEASAGKASDEAERDISAGNLSMGLRELNELSRVYAGSPFGDKAKDRIAELRATPPTTAPAAAPAPSANKVPPSAPATRPQPTVSQPDADCKRWMSLADSYIDNGNPEEAKVYLQKIIDQYPSSTWADTARQKLQNLQ